MAERIEVDYAQLEKMGALLTQRAETVEEQVNRLRQTMEALRNVWKGEAADDFFAEMDDRAMPSMRRLQDALSRTGQTLKQVSSAYRQAEEQSGNLFKGGGGGGFGRPGGGFGGGFDLPTGGGNIGGAVGDGSVKPGDGSVIGGGPIGEGVGGLGGSIGGAGGGFGGGAGGGFGGGAGGGFGGGAGGGFGGGGGSNFASDQLAFRGGAVANGFNTVRDATVGLNPPTGGANVDPLSGKVTGKGAMVGGVAGIGDIAKMSDFMKDFFNNNQAQLQSLVNSAQNAISTALQAINNFAQLVNTLF
ncbi:MAG: WXG100 family type VII secretion target [Anaerolineae bacterium]|jgi:WXG100 family type VII secretion target|nr:WXG100 family type VII secretion target [Anaerolineae bacterium]